MIESNLQKLKVARDKVADVYQDLATDEIPDNGNLSTLNEAILKLNVVIKIL